MIGRPPSRITARATALVLLISFVFGTALTSAAPNDRKPPTTPTNLRVTATTPASVSFAWNPSTDNSGSVSYRIHREGYHIDWSTSQTSYTWTSLAPSTTYTFYVYAVDRAGNRSGNSNTVTATTAADVTPPTAPVLSGSVLSPSQIALSWTRSTDDVAMFVGYRILANGSPVTEHLNWYAERSVRIRHLTPATTYVVTIEARDGSGNTATSNAISLTTPPSSDTSAPTAPTNLHLIFDQGCAEVWLGWTQATDDVDPQSLIEYEIYVNGVLSPLPVSAGVDQDFVYGTAQGDNTFVVKAVDQTGNTSAASNAITLFLWPC
ncbi:MAG TPA: fibronectin type III domain-containing protein [Herpetosiphonaceae bacterium]